MSWSALRQAYFSDIYLEEMSKTTQNISQDSRHLGEIRTDHLPNRSQKCYRLN